MKTARDTEKNPAKEPRSLSVDRNKEPPNRNADRYNRAKSLERSRAANGGKPGGADADAKKWGYKRGEAHWQKLKDNEFEWSEDFKKRQSQSVFDRLGAANKRDVEPAQKKPKDEPPTKPAATRKPTEVYRPLKPSQDAAGKGGDERGQRTSINAKPRVDTWRTPRKKAGMAEVVVDKVTAEKEGDTGEKKE